MKNLILDVDGVLTDGQFHYTVDGKVAKVFGPNDADALVLIKPFINIVVISGDKRGFAITQKRVEEDMKLPLFLVSTHDRATWISERYDPAECIYMGDGIFDAKVFAVVGYSIAPANAFEAIKQYANHVTKARGGSGAVAEACFHIMEKFFTPLDMLKLTLVDKGGEGVIQQKSKNL